MLLPSQLPTNTHIITLRLMTEAYLPLLCAWLNRPHVLQWWADSAIDEAGPTLAVVRTKYLPRVLQAEQVTSYVALLDDKPIGYAQSYVAMGSGGGWWPEITDPGVRGIDQFLANVDQLNQGLGTQLVQVLVNKLFADPAITLIHTDPAPGKHRAIRCYEKAGFVAQGSIHTPDGPALYMTRRRGD
jgi:aminoglycoside 6'-N-acetyltransferase Ib